MLELHVWEFAGCEWVIAASKEDAVKVWCEFTGVDEEIAEDEEDDWEQLPDDQIFKMWCDPETGKPGEIGEGQLVERPCLYWIEKMGRCYLGTTEA